ncbi:MAG TPA: NrfD/PsrC family molybdoenzyme membrane anchor subunit [Acidimicrobiia bacterium]|nr:NrfD/PsrC family molybdoenzyme membrane anchor subunit [Acidimicrobiia bacterium]
MALLAPPTNQLPYGVGRFSRRWMALIGGLFAVVVFGFIAYITQLRGGLAVTGMRNIGPMGGATWALYVTFIIFFVGLSFAGITVAALIRLARIDTMRPVARMAELLTVVSLIVAAMVVMADIGRPIQAIVNLFKYARPQSPFFGTFTLVISGYLFASAVYLYLDGRRDAAVCAKVPGRLQRFHRIWAAGYQDTPEERSRHHRVTGWLAIAIIPLLITAHSTLGFVFGLQVSRPGWHSALQAPAFVVLAGTSGIGMLLVIAAVMRRGLPSGDQLREEIFTWLSRALAILVLVYIYFVAVELLTTIYAGAERERAFTEAIITGQFAWIFWLSMAALLGTLVVLAVQRGRPGISLGWLITAGLLVQVAAIGKRFLVVVPSQTDGTLLPYGQGSYSPTWVEIAIILGLVALGTLLYTGFVHIFPIIEIPHDDDAVVRAPKRAKAAVRAPKRATPDAPGRDRTVTIISIAMVVVGFTLQIVSYLALAAPLGTSTTAADSDPRLPFAPVIFILGVVLVFLAAVVYELLPQRLARRRAVQA